VAETGAHVNATARDLKKAPGLQSLLQTHGEELQVVTLDIADIASIKVQSAWACACSPAKARRRSRRRCSCCGWRDPGRPLKLDSA
jgi:hypothetical protein